jgi:hypothetical protein
MPKVLVSLRSNFFNIIEGSGSFSSKLLNISGMDNLLLKRVLFERLRDR